MARNQSIGNATVVTHSRSAFAAAQGNRYTCRSEVSESDAPSQPGEASLSYFTDPALELGAEILVDFTSAFGGTADMAGPVADLVPVENDPSETSTSISPKARS